MRALSSAVLLVLMLGSCGLKAPIYIPKDPLLCLGCFGNKEKSKVEGQKKTLDEPIDKEKFKYIPKVKGQKN
jgi:predicted small lipoprotein YifL